MMEIAVKITVPPEENDPASTEAHNQAEKSNITLNSWDVTVTQPENMDTVSDEPPPISSYPVSLDSEYCEFLKAVVVPQNGIAVSSQVVKQDNLMTQSAKNAPEESVPHAYKRVNKRLEVFCCKCKNQYPTLKRLNRHIYFSNKKDRFSCVFCNHPFRDRSIYFKHNKAVHAMDRNEQIKKQSTVKARYKIHQSLKNIAVDFLRNQPIRLDTVVEERVPQNAKTRVEIEATEQLQFSSQTKNGVPGPSNQPENVDNEIDATPALSPQKTFRVSKRKEKNKIPEHKSAMAVQDFKKENKETLSPKLTKEGEPGSEQEAGEMSHNYRCREYQNGIFKCTCGETFPDSTCLYRHVRRESKTQLFSCDFCNSRYRLLNGLIIHFELDHNSTK